MVADDTHFEILPASDLFTLKKLRIVSLTAVAEELT